jgi:hypothetical protein
MRKGKMFSEVSMAEPSKETKIKIQEPEFTSTTYTHDLSLQSIRDSSSTIESKVPDDFNVPGTTALPTFDKFTNCTLQEEGKSKNNSRPAT